jgi:hypothetical protein
MSDTSDQPDDEPDPVARRNAEDERQEREHVDLDQELDEQQEKLERLMHDDTVGVIWFGEDDAWLDKRLGDNG